MSDIEVLQGLTHFIVEFSEQQQYESGKTWWANKTLQVVAADIYRVLEIFREQHPDARVHVVRRFAPSATIYIDR